MPFPASFSLFLSFQYTVDSKQMFNINKFMPMSGFEPQTSGIGSDRSTNWATTTAHFDLFSTFDIKHNENQTGFAVNIFSST